MEQRHDWLTRTKIVWMVDAIGVTVDCLLLATLSVGAVLWGPVNLLLFLFMESDDYYSSNDSYAPQSSDDETVANVKLFTWFGLGLAVVLCFVEIFAVWKLATACSSRCQVITAVKNARIWRNIKIFFSMYYTIRAFGMLRAGLNVVDVVATGKLLGNLVGILVVQRFIFKMQELMAARTNWNGDPFIVAVETEAD